MQGFDFICFTRSKYTEHSHKGFPVDLATYEVPSLLSSALYNSFSEALDHKMYETR